MLCQFSKYGKFYPLDNVLLFFKSIEVLYSKEMEDEEH